MSDGVLGGAGLVDCLNRRLNCLIRIAQEPLDARPRDFRAVTKIKTKMKGVDVLSCGRADERCLKMRKRSDLIPFKVAGYSNRGVGLCYPDGISQLRSHRYTTLSKSQSCIIFSDALVEYVQPTEEPKLVRKIAQLFCDSQSPSKRHTGFRTVPARKHKRESKCALQL